MGRRGATTAESRNIGCGADFGSKVAIGVSWFSHAVDVDGVLRITSPAVVVVCFRPARYAARVPCASNQGRARPLGGLPGAIGVNTPAGVLGGGGIRWLPYHDTARCS